MIQIDKDVAKVVLKISLICFVISSAFKGWATLAGGSFTVAGVVSMGGSLIGLLSLYIAINLAKKMSTPPPAPPQEEEQEEDEEDDSLDD